TPRPPRGLAEARGAWRAEGRGRAGGRRAGVASFRSSSTSYREGSRTRRGPEDDGTRRRCKPNLVPRAPTPGEHVVKTRTAHHVGPHAHHGSPPARRDDLPARR